MIIPSEREPVAPSPVKLSKVLLVEGATPQHFFEAFATFLSIDKQIEIRNYMSIGQLELVLRTLAAGADFKENVRSLGITRDAENDPAAAADAIRNAVRRARIGDHVKVSMAVLPDDNTTGMIETLCLRSVSDRREFQCVEEFFNCLTSNGIVLPEQLRVAKHHIQVFLATRPKAQLTCGIAAAKGAFPLDHPCFDRIRTFLQNM